MFAQRRWAALGLALGVGVLGVVSAVAQSPVLHLEPGETREVDCPTRLDVDRQRREAVELRCRPGAGTPLPASPTTAAPLPTLTPAPPSATPLPTPTLVPTSVPVALHEGVPVCTDHDPTQWHPLVQRDGSGTITCTYTHTHFDDPRVLDGVFGPLPQGQTISYPWETNHENRDKHNVYKWAVIHNPTCASATGEVTLRYLRWQYHGDALTGILNRFHSTFAQAQFCDPAAPTFAPFVQFGGHLDTGPLFLEGIGHYPLPNDGQPPQGPDVLAGCCNRRLHGSTVQPRQDYTWYVAYGRGGPLAFFGGLRNEEWGPLDPAAPNTPQLFYGGGQNQSYQEPAHIFGVTNNFAPQETGYTDVLGRLRPDCAALGPTCIPFVLRGFPPGGGWEYRPDRQGPPPGQGVTTEYDVPAPNGNSLIKFPN